MPNEQLMSDEDQKGLILGSLASGVLSAIVGARSGNIDPMAAGLAGAGAAYGGGHKQISEIRKAAQGQKDKQRTLAVSEAAQAESERYNKQRGDYYAGLSVDLNAQRKASAEKLISEKAKLDEALAQGKIDRTSHAEGMKALLALYSESARPETEQEALSGLMPVAGVREPDTSQLIQQAARYPSTEKTVQALLKPKYAAEAASAKAGVQETAAGKTVEAKKEAAVTKVGAEKEAAVIKAEVNKEAAKELAKTQSGHIAERTAGQVEVKKTPGKKAKTGVIGWLEENKKKGEAGGATTIPVKGGLKLPADFPAPGPEGQKRRLPDGSIVTSKGGKWQ